MREYFGRRDMGYGHSPIVNTMKPVEQAPELTPGGGWHSDFPYNGNMFEAKIPFGIQCNICFDEFREDNGETAAPVTCRCATVPLSMCHLSPVAANGGVAARRLSRSQSRGGASY